MSLCNRYFKNNNDVSYTTEESHTENVHGPPVSILDNTKSWCKTSPKIIIKRQQQY